MNTKFKPSIVRHAQVVLVMGLFAASCLAALAQTTNRFFEFVQAQSKRQYTQVPHEVLAFYYGWYGQFKQTARGVMDTAWEEVNTNKHEILKTARYPVNGPYSSQDVSILDWQIDQAKSHGITGFVVSWSGTGPEVAWQEKSLQLLVERAEKKNFKISICWEQAPDEGRGQINRAIGEISYVLQRYGKSPVYLKVDGKPVIFAYGRLVYQVPVGAWPEIIEGIRAKAGDFALIADGHQDSYVYLFDGIHSYDLSGLPFELERNLTVGRLSDLRTWVAKYYAKAVTMARQCGRISCLMVMPGSDQRRAYKFDWQTHRLDGQTYRTLWEEAIRANPDWVIITSWNEWPEGTEIEPSLELGDQYLQITDEYSKRFLKSAPVKVPPPAFTLPKLAPGTTREADKLLVGRKVGVLMEDRLNDSEFWAAYCGASLQRLTWKDLIDAKYFNASNFSVLVHIGKEHYTSSVKATDDVTRALVRYMRQGGFLVSLPTGTWPLLYDDSRKSKPYAITDTLAMGVDNGFEQPPSGSDLIFHAKTNVLFGLQATAAFPRTGDLRFVPTRRTRVPATEVYTPLVQLKDNAGNWQGDAVSYIEHRTPSLSGGKSLYVWMRTAESFGPDVFLPSLYQFVSTRLKPLPSANPPP
jgi:hypothetical protein